MKDTKSLTLLVLFGTGSAYETKRINGISHFLEHMFFKGTKSRPKPGEVSAALDDLGAEHNAFTSKELTGYWVKAASNHFAVSLDIVSDILLEPLFEEEEINKERGVIFQEMSMYLDTPRRRVHDVFEELLYGDQPIGWDIIGTRESLSGLRRKDFLQYRKGQYVGSNAVVVLAGNFKEEQAINALRKAFSPLSKGTPRKKPKTKGVQRKPAVQIEQKRTDQTHIVLGARAFGMHDKRRHAAAVLSTILGGKSSSRLFEEIREKRGLAYTVGASMEHFADAGYFAVYAGVPHEKTKEVVECIVAELQKIRKDGITEKELKSAKDYWRGQFAIGLESSDEVASFFATQELFRKHIVTPEELLEKVGRVSQAEVETVARELFMPNGMNMAVIGPHKDGAVFSDILRMV